MGQLLLPSPHQPHSRTSPCSCWARCLHQTKGSHAIGGANAVTASATFRETFDKFLPHSTPSAPGSEVPCAFDHHRLRSASAVHATELPGPGGVRVGSGWGPGGVRWEVCWAQSYNHPLSQVPLWSPLLASFPFGAFDI